MNHYTDILREYLETVYHDRVRDLYIRYPRLLRNRGILRRLVARYPNRPRTPEELRQLESLLGDREFSLGDRLLDCCARTADIIRIPFNRR